MRFFSSFLKENGNGRNIDQYLVVILLLNTSKPVSLISDFLFSINRNLIDFSQSAMVNCAEVVDGIDVMT